MTGTDFKKFGELTTSDARAITFDNFRAICGNHGVSAEYCQLSKKGSKKCRKQNCSIWNDWPSVGPKHKLVTFEQFSVECQYFGKTKSGMKTVCAREQMGNQFVAGSCRADNCNTWAVGLNKIRCRIVRRIV